MPRVSKKAKPKEKVAAAAVEQPMEDKRSFSARHVWVLPDEENCVATVGITDYLAEDMDSILSIDMPLPGDELEIDTFCIHLHMHNHIHHLRSPLSGRVLEVNKEVMDNTSLLHLDPNKHWLYKMEYDDPDELELLMSAQQYARHLDQL